MAPETAIIIRTRNEERWIGTVLKILNEQTYKNFEIIIVDSGSTDHTLEIVRKFSVITFTIPQQSFSYPYALNYAIQRSSATKYILILSAHSLPISSVWLEDGITHLKKDEKILGVYGPIAPLPDATFWDNFFQRTGLLLHYFFMRKPVRVITKAEMGTLGFTNALIRKELWGTYHFNEAYGAGGEDGEWAGYWFGRGYAAIRDNRFMVRHSHYLGFWDWIREFKNWKSLAKPRPFAQLGFRRDGAHDVD
ncbi:MAG: glycosyltransferase family 2 protein [Candidatus Sungbacteria bacterium]|nr:glycosyltransferase family 2 protein [bacterium]MDZ4260474.1 glycosyltransferase family 2 protein [Candidatus Sungbacteria bacterium]